MGLRAFIELPQPGEIPTTQLAIRTTRGVVFESSTFPVNGPDVKTGPCLNLSVAVR